MVGRIDDGSLSNEHDLDLIGSSGVFAAVLLN